MSSARIATSLLATLAITLGLAGAAAGGNGHGKGQARTRGHRWPIRQGSSTSRPATATTSSPARQGDDAAGSPAVATR